MGDILILTILGAVVLLAVRSMLKNRKNGCCGSCSGCSGNCSGCNRGCVK